MSPRFAMFERALDRWARSNPFIVAITVCLAWPIATELVQLLPGFGSFYGVPFAFAAVVIAAWAGGLTGGLTATVLSAFLLYLILPEVRVITVEKETAWHVVTFAAAAILTSGFEASLKNKNERLHRERAMRDEFLGIISHELRTPITVIYGGVHMLHNRWEKLPAPEREGLLCDIEEESLRLSRMTEDLLRLSRIDRATLGQGEPILVGRLVRKSVEAFGQATPERQLSVELSENELIAQGDEGYLDSVLRNLLGNADKYSPQGSPILVRAEKQGESVKVCVRDYGPGISERQLESIFDPYYRDPARAEGSRGLGLGLTLCKRAIEAMKGRIWAELCEGGGLQVCFTLPMSDDVNPPGLAGRPTGAATREK